MNPSKRGWILTALLIVPFMSAVEATIVASSIPTIVGSLGGFDLFSWVFGAYLIAGACTTPIAGRVADLYGRRRVLLAGVTVFVAGSVACGFAWDIHVLILFRALQGIGAGALSPIALTLVGDLYKSADRGRVESYMAATWAAAAMLGPLAAQALVGVVSWRLVFWINIPFGIASFLIIALMLTEDIERRPHKIDYLGMVMMMAASVGIMVSAVQATALGMTTVFALAGASLIVLALFLWHETRVAEPMLELELWRNGLFACANLGSFAIGGVLMGIIGFSAPYIQGVMGQSPVAASVALSALSVFWAVGAASAGRLITRLTYRRNALIGAPLLILGGATMIAVTPASSHWQVLVGACLMALGIGFSFTSFMVALQALVPWRQRGAATSTMMFTRNLGQSIGAAAFGGLVNAGLSGHGVAGDGVNRLMTETTRAALPAAERDELVAAAAAAIHNVYIVDGVLALVIITAVLFGLPAGLRSPKPDEVTAEVRG